MSATNQQCDTAIKLRLEAIVENVDYLTEFVNEQLDGMDCPRKTRAKIDVALDELFSNVCHYAYGEDTGYLTIYVEELVEGHKVSMTLEDEGVPFDPLSQAEPDVTLGLEERQIGGLGIFLVRKTMDEVSYEYVDGKNRLTLIKAW